MALSVTLDWLSFTFKEDTHEAAKWVSIYASPEKAVATAPVKNYTDAYRAENGVIYNWNTRRAEQGYHIVIGGSALRNIWQHYEFHQQAFIQAVLDAGGRISRLDLAKDAKDVEIDYNEIYRKLDAGEHIGTARKIQQRRSENGGNTIYIGSFHSEKFARIYNKSAESKLQNVLWGRFELETKGRVAKMLARQLVNTADWSAVFDGVALHMANLPQDPSFGQFFSAETVPIGLPKIEKQSDREKWISSQVMPAVVKHFIEYPDSKAVALLRAMLDSVEGQQSK